jgi:hypothetical protein
MTLGYSRKSVRLLTFQSRTQIWAELHEKAFRRLGGAVRVVVLDNLREGVLTPDIYDPSLNPLYRDVLAHYGAVALACRVGDPDRKGKVESGVGHAKKTPLKGQRFESLEQAQTYLDHWEQRWADTRIHGTTKRGPPVRRRSPRAAALPLEPFRYQYGERTASDGCRNEAAYWRAAKMNRRRVQVQWSAQQVRLLDPKTGSCCDICVRSAKASDHDETAPANPLGTLQRWRGPPRWLTHGAFATDADQQGPPPALQALSFSKVRRGAVEEVCAIALDMEVYSYQTCAFLSGMHSRR